MRKILIKVWQGELSPGQALNLIQDGYIRDGPNCRFWLRELDERVLYILKAVQEKAITVNEAEEEIKEEKKWIIARAKRKARIRNQAQAEKSCCA